MYTRYYLLVIYHVLYFVMINKGCRVSQTMPGFLSFVDLDVQQILEFLSLFQRYLRPWPTVNIQWGFSQITPRHIWHGRSQYTAI